MQKRPRLVLESSSLAGALSALAKIRDLVTGAALHAAIVKRSFDSQADVSNALINLYAKSGAIAAAAAAFRSAAIQDAASWNSLISGYVRHGELAEAVAGFNAMAASPSPPDQITLSSLLSACASSPSRLGESIHGRSIRLGLQSQPSVANSLISFYSKSGDLESAEGVFHAQSERNAVSYNSMLAGLLFNGRFLQGIELLRATPPALADAVTAIAAAQICSELCIFSHGMAVHGFSLRRAFEEQNQSVENSLLHFYASAGRLTSAQNLFVVMRRRDIVSWNTLISGCSRWQRKRARELFKVLLQTGLRCSIGTCLAITPSFSSPEDCFLGRSVHGWTLKSGLVDQLQSVNALIQMYINCGDLASSSALFHGLAAASAPSPPDVVSWNSMIVGCAQHGLYLDALKLFSLMLAWSCLKPDHITMVSVFSACGQLSQLSLGGTLHGFCMKLPVASHVRLNNSLLTMYSRCGDVASSESVFRETRGKNLCSWNCMISSYVQRRESRKALETYRRMGDVDLDPDEITAVGLLCSCAHLGCTKLGRGVHGYALRHGMTMNSYVSAAIIDMYCKCGWLEAGVRLFESSGDARSVACFNSMIMGYGLHGHGWEAIRLFSEMKGKRISPNKITYICILSACSHCGLVDQGWEHFKDMGKHGIEAMAEHHVCMVDMLGRAGEIDEACKFIASLPCTAEPGVWGALLSACKDHDDVQMGRLLAEYLFNCEPWNVGYYVSLSNLYAASEKWSDAVSVRTMMDDRGLVKAPGRSFIDPCSI
ncbi:tetratricopeptide repeat (TPR)-like superfamily protein [Wolffia australiana]